MKFNLVALLVIVAFVAVASIQSAEAKYDYSACSGVEEHECPECCGKKGFNADRSHGYSFRTRWFNMMAYECGCWKDEPKKA